MVVLSCLILHSRPILDGGHVNRRTNMQEGPFDGSRMQSGSYHTDDLSLRCDVKNGTMPRDVFHTVRHLTNICDSWRKSYLVGAIRWFI